MAQVPGRAITPQVDVGAAPSGRFEAPQFVNYEAQNAIQAGQGLQQLGGALGQVASDMAEKANTARLDDAANQAKNFAMDLRYNKDSGYLNFKGESALKRPNGMSLADEYSDKLKTKLDSISEGLGNTGQRDAFKRFSGNMMTQFRGEAMQHEAQQNNVYMGSVAQATQDTAAREIALSWNDPNGIDGAAQRLKIAAYQEASLTGKSPEWAEAKAREVLSRGHSLALTAAIDRGDFSGANSYLDKYSSQMQADDILRARSAIDKQDSNLIVNTAVDNAYTKNGANFSGSDTNRALNIMWGSESNFRQFDKSGNVIASVKGARGMSQVMPGTAPEAAKLAGLEWNQELFYRKMTGDPIKDQEAIDYNRALGKAYFTKQLQDNGGHIDMAFAAYNAGPGALKDAVKRAGKEGGTYLQYLPPETQKYVTSNVQAFNSGKGHSVPSQKAMDDEVLSSLGPDATESQKQYALSQSRKRYDQLITNQQEQGYQSINTAIDGLRQNGGNFDALPVELQQNIPFNKIGEVKAYADKIANGTLRTNTDVYNKLSDPKLLVKLSDGEFNTLRADLEPKDFQQFSSERAALRSGKALNAAGDIPRESINTALAEKLVQLGIDPTPKSSEGKEQMRIGALKQFVANQVLEQQAGLGRKMNDKEVGALVNQLFLRNFKFKNTLLGFEFGGSKSISYMSMKYGDIPTGDRDMIELKLKERGLKPSEGDVLGIYLNMKMGNGNG